MSFFARLSLLWIDLCGVFYVFRATMKHERIGWLGYERGGWLLVLFWLFAFLPRLFFLRVSSFFLFLALMVTTCIYVLWKTCLWLCVVGVCDGHRIPDTG